MDTLVIHLRVQYQIMLHLWTALHIHRSGNSEEFMQIVNHSEEACKVMKAMLHSVPSPGPRASMAAKTKLISPKQIVAPAKKVMGRSNTKVKTTTARARATKAALLPPVTPKPKRGMDPLCST